MSGGVDSSVSAALLARAGYDVAGAFIRVWYPPGIYCSAGDDRRDAERVAAKIGIPLVTVNLEKEYKNAVIDVMFREYARGRTPNPDILCNEKVKFGAFLAWARKRGADAIATGHYARVLEHGGRPHLLAGKDKAKDQSYFLYRVGERELGRVMFPVGAMEKPQVRKLARRFGLPTAEKKDSQGLCFVGKFDFKEFLKRYVPTKEGGVVDTNGNVIGRHDGAALYTLGERHGFTVTKKGPHDPPYYVVSRDVEKNTLTVARGNEEKKFFKRRVALSRPRWISGKAPALSGTYRARIRYRQPLQSCRLVKRPPLGIPRGPTSGNPKWGYMVVFNRPQRAVTPGQSLVLYRGAECLGGGVII